MFTASMNMCRLVVCAQVFSVMIMRAVTVTDYQHIKRRIGGDTLTPTVPGLLVGWPGRADCVVAQSS